MTPPADHALRLAERLDGVVALDLAVESAHDVIPGLRSVRLAGDLTGFAPLPGQDLMVSVPPGGDAPRWRRYTLRRMDLDAGSLELWITTSTDGPGAAWAVGATAGDRVDVVGPRGKIRVHEDARTHLFVVDETGVAAAAAMAESIAPPARVLVVALLVPNPQWSPDDSLSPTVRRGVQHLTHVLDVEDHNGVSTLLDHTLRPLVGDRCAAYVFGERRVVRRVVDLFVGFGLDPARVASKAYWRDDQANEANGEPNRADNTAGDPPA
jgi:NADPH-dependent ferric siderophore reductase